MAQETQNSPSSNSELAFDGITAFHPLPEETRDYLRSICSVHQLSMNDTLAHQGDEVHRVYFVKSGLLRMQKHLVDGRVQIVGLLPPEHLTGTIFPEKHVFAIEAAAPSKVLSFKAQQFRSAVSSTPELEQILFRAFQNEIDASYKWLLLLSHNKVRERLAGFFIMLFAGYQNIPQSVNNRQNPLSVMIPLSRTDLSNLLGVRTESLSRAFHALADDGIIEIIKHDHIKIVDINELLMEIGDPDFFMPSLGPDLEHKARK